MFDSSTPPPALRALLTGLQAAQPASPIRNWLEALRPEIGTAFAPGRNGHLPRWRAALDAIVPPAPDATPVLNAAMVCDGAEDPQNRETWMSFHPWRKGPYRLGGMDIDTEWRSDLKWDRLLPALDPLEGRACLDVGCGNGYHLWRMCGAGASLAVGLDPFLLYVFQFLAIQKRIPLPGIGVLPLPANVIRPGLDFDTVFSMGVLYHCREAAGHLRLLRNALRPGGQLVLETLTVPENHGPVLRPAGRYAQMRNIHALPAVDTLVGWVAGGGFRNVTVVDTTVTLPTEQRATDWMTFHSLRDFLDPVDPTRTIEGHPAPRRTLVVASA